jgi:hypothetical protein
MTPAMTPDKRRREQASGKEWARNLGSRLHDFIDAQVLGDFEWIDWGVERKPSGAFMNAAFDEAQYIEETRGAQGR